MKNKRLLPQVRKEEILAAALALSRVRGYDKVTRAEIAQAAGCSATLPSVYFGTITKMRRAIMSAAVAAGDVRVIAQGLVRGEAKAKAAPLELREQAAGMMMRGEL